LLGGYTILVVRKLQGENKRSVQRIDAHCWMP
jgi:hypothetical protein